jgi:OmpA-OmpF porin, OOP family
MVFFTFLFLIHRPFMLKKIAIAAALAVVSIVSMAAEPPSLYVGGDVGSTRDDESEDRETGIGVFAGYQFNQHIGLEAGFRRLAENETIFDSERVESSADQLSLSAIGTLPLNHGFSVYGRLGYNRVNVKARIQGVRYGEHFNRALYGIGAAYSFNQMVSVRVELQKPVSDLTNLSAGVAFRF